MRYPVKAALLRNVIITVGVEQRGFGALFFLRLDDVSNIDELVVPGIYCGDLGWIVGEHVRHDAARHRRDDFLPPRRERYDAEFDLVAAGLLVIRHDLLERDVLLRDKALHPPHFRGRTGRIRGRAKVPAAARPTELRSTERLVKYVMPVFLP